MNPLAPASTPLDVRFRLFGTPVRIQPGFWLFAVALGWFSDVREPRSLLTFVVALCLSVLVHEMGHALMARLCGEPCRIFLFMFGGAAVSDGDRLRGRQRILIALAGPAAGFLFFALAHFGKQELERWLTENPQALGVVTKTILRQFLSYVYFMTLFYNLMNLLPIYPLDGGQVVRELFLGVSPSHGVTLSLGFSFLLAGFVAAYSYLVYRGHELWYPPLSAGFSAIFFGLMAVQSLLALMSERRSAPQQEFAEQSH